MSDLTTWLAGLPSLVLFLGFALAGVALVLIVDFVLRRRMEAGTRTEAGRTAAIMLGVLATADPGVPARAVDAVAPSPALAQRRNGR